MPHFDLDAPLVEPHHFAVDAGVPITDPITAFCTIAQFLAAPACDEVIAMLLDHRRRGVAIVHVDDVVAPDDVFDAAPHIVRVGGVDTGSIVLLTSRPDGSLDDLDARRWTVLDDLFHGCGMTLLEWFVVTDSLDLPRTRAGDSSRWPAASEASKTIR